MSKWDKLLMRICSLSRDLRFDELRKVLESYGYKIMLREVGAVIIHFKNLDASQLQYQSMNQLRRFMWNL